MTKKEREQKEKVRKIIDRIVEIALIIIIILLLLHNCELSKKNQNTSNGNVNIIDITCDGKKCGFGEDVPLDCLVNESSSKCIVPNFVGKSKEDVLNWLSTLANFIDIEFKTATSKEKDGTVLDQSILGISVKELINSKNKLVFTISNNGSLVDCLVDSSNSRCVLPNFVGKKKNDVKRWLNMITNYVKVKYVYKESNSRPGTILNQSITGGRSVKDIIDSGETLVITIATNKKTRPSSHSNSNNNNNKGGNNDGTDGGSDEEEQDEGEITGEFYVNDSNIRWSDSTNLRIFVDSLYNLDGKIAPESSNTYKFVVNNKTAYNLKYSISFMETNPYSMNMKYKLKKNNSYVISDYVSYNQLNLANQVLNSKKSDTFYLEWKWVSSDNDNQAGKAQANYKLKINVEAESIDG
ncbi:MAG: hypothetical protein IKE63_04265 [Bacilli bacterium]|nr:hypothetical protein [Bacilli bacterium]